MLWLTLLMSKCQTEVSLPDHREVDLFVMYVPVAITVARRDNFEVGNVSVITAWSVIFVREKFACTSRDISRKVSP